LRGSWRGCIHVVIIARSRLGDTLSHSRVQRQFNDKRRPLPFAGRFNPNLAVVRVNKYLCEIEAEASAENITVPSLYVLSLYSYINEVYISLIRSL